MSPGSIKDAAREAIKSADNVTGERKMGGITVLLVRMNADLLMGEDLKKTGADNLFTVNV